jgi:soluble lytic murein transglycosylase-like protein
MKIDQKFKLAYTTTSAFFILGTALLATGCATTRHAQNSNDPFTVPDAPTTSQNKEDLPKVMPGTTSSVGQTASESITTNSESGASSSNNNEIIYRGMKIQNATFDLPVEMNRAVEKWIDYFAGRGRDRFAQYLERSEYFIPFLKPILKNAKAPEDLVYLAMIESGFNNNARSNARAVGAWQFISATGRRYGLDVNWWLDERRDVEKSTIAAVQYLKELNAMFGSWHLKQKFSARLKNTKPMIFGSCVINTARICARKPRTTCRNFSRPPSSQKTVSNLGLKRVTPKLKT